MGPADPSRGGIATVVDTIARSDTLGRRYRFVVVRTHCDGGALRKTTLAVSALLRLAALSASRRIDLVHVHSASGSSFVRKAAAVAIAHGLRRPVLFHVHGGAFDRQLRRTGIAGRFRRAAVVWVLRNADAVVVLTPTWAAQLTSAAGGTTAPLRVIPNGIDPEPPPAVAEVEPGLVVFLGDLRREKGVFELVEAVARLVPTHPDLHVVLGGAGPARDELEALGASCGIPSGRLVLPGWLGATPKQELLGRAACFALPSYEEGLPLVLIEAMAAGRPIVTTPVGGVPDIVRAGREAVLVPPRDVDALADALRQVLDEPGRARRLGAAAARRSKEFTGARLAERLDAVYRDLLESTA